MTTDPKTTAEVEADLQQKRAELLGLEDKLVALHDLEWAVRCEIAHLESVVERLKAVGL